MGACPAGPTGPTLKPGEFVGFFESAAMVGSSNSVISPLQRDTPDLVILGLSKPHGTVRSGDNAVAHLMTTR
jgi:hypothetical protein